MGQLVLRGEELAAILRGPTGPTTRALIVVADKVKARTRASLKPGFPADFLGPRIVKRVLPGPVVQVGTDKVKTGPHVINGNPVLAFEWPKAGPGVFFFGHVNHPGSDFTEYLTKKLNEALASTRGAI